MPATPKLTKSDVGASNMARIYGTVFERFLAKIRVSDTLSWNGTPCWIWTDAPNKGGYGMLNIFNRARLAHRVSFSIFRHRMPGPMLDHRCRTRKCVNPDHIEEVSPLVNFERGDGSLGLALGPATWRAKTHCPLGHPYDEENTKITLRGHRRCKECHRIEARERHARSK